MEKEVYQSKYFKALYDEDTKIYTSIYLPETENMTDKAWKALMTDLKNIIETYKPEYIIDDNRNRLYSYCPDIQEWTLNLFINSWNSIGLKKYVQIKPRGTIEKLTTRQIEEMAVKEFSMTYPHKIVDDYESAIEWIREGEDK